MNEQQMRDYATGRTEREEWRMARSDSVWIWVAVGAFWVGAVVGFGVGVML